MPQSTLQLCWPGLLLIAGMLLGLRLLLALCGARMRLARLRALHGDQQGSVHSLSFILALPIFIMVLMGIVQVSQMMIAHIYVQYAAVAAARSASVWIPATIVDGDEGSNEIRDLVPDGQGPDGSYYRVAPGSHKAFRVQMAAAQALMSIAPSRDTVDGAARDHLGYVAFDAVQRAYASLVPASQGDPSINRRLANKLAYSLENTAVEIRIFHPSVDPELVWWDIPPDRGQFYPNEIGDRDSITVHVTHNVALLPGPGRMLARAFQESPERNAGATPIVEKNDTAVWPVRASATMGNEGRKPMIRYDHVSTGRPY
jgi:hypothetical protein